MKSGIILDPADTVPDSVSLYTKGGALEETQARKLLEAKDILNKLIEELSSDIRKGNSIKCSFQELLERSLEKFQLCEEMQWGMRSLFAAFDGTLYATDLVQLSGGWYHEPGCQGKEYVFPGGFSQVVDVLRKSIKTTRVELNTPITEVTWGASGCQLRDSRGGIWKGRAAVITLPLGVLKDSVAGGVGGAPLFEPPLPTPVVIAISALGWGTLNKAWIIVEEDPCPEDPKTVNIVYLPPLPPPSSTPPPPPPPSSSTTITTTSTLFPWILKQRREASGGCSFVGLISGSPATEAPTIEHLSASFLAQLTEMYGVDYFFSARILSKGAVAWDKDPWARGSYSFQGLDSSPESRALLAGAGGSLTSPLFFAGEHVAEVGGCGYTNGAVDSGKKAALEVASFLSSRRS